MKDVLRAGGRREHDRDRARTDLSTWSAIMASDRVADALLEPMRAMAVWYGVLTSGAYTPHELWAQLRPTLEDLAQDLERYEPSGPEAQAISEAKSRTKARQVSPSVRRSGDGRILSPHTDEEGWLYQLCDVFGTRSLSAVHGFVDQLRSLLSPFSGDDQGELNAALAIVGAAKPKNELQAALAVNVAALQVIGMRAAAQAAGVPNPANVSAYARCARAQADTVLALDRLQNRNRSKQTIIVKSERHDHRHMHLHEAAGGYSDFQSQPLAPPVVVNDQVLPPIHLTSDPKLSHSEGAPRCGARTRSGRPCQSPAVKGKARCRMHGGSPGSGAPSGQRNGSWKDGAFTNGAVAFRRHLSKVLRECRQANRQAD